MTMNTPTTTHSKNLNKYTLNPYFRELSFYISLPVYVRVSEIEKELQSGVKKPFKKLYKSIIGDCHAMGQIPITFIRQVLSIVTYPELLRSCEMPEDVKSRAKDLLMACAGHSIGAYTAPFGMEMVRKHCAQYITKRDEGLPSDWTNIILGNGATSCIKSILHLLQCEVNSKRSGVMIPVPQYPLYQAALKEFNLHQINYYLDESSNWSLEVTELDRALLESKKVSYPRAIVIINPGNPTGQVLTRKNMEEIVKFAHVNNLIILADEVYQQNIYDDNSEFISFKRVIMEMGLPYSEIELVSFMSCSKGYMGECGIRGGFIEIVNMDPFVKNMYMEVVSSLLCPNVMGQIVLDLVCNPPEKGEPSYDQFILEKSKILNTFKEKARLVKETFDSIEGISCNPVQGAMYAFPQIHFPPKFIDEAKKQSREPDDLYTVRLVDETGICVSPGSLFGQQSGTYHFRNTILHQTDDLKEMLYIFKTFHENFIKIYS
ncbi:hypothetical protein WA026_003217 [Henosepilachna vigintioctopunctata]|uniref:alanine transaminase n=1 Tax=Henosepilachna vigintioctopunctata TaxID=420089 RepID=A0AAW1TNA8_9CUCU